MQHTHWWTEEAPFLPPRAALLQKGEGKGERLQWVGKQGRGAGLERELAASPMSKIQMQREKEGEGGAGLHCQSPSRGHRTHHWCSRNHPSMKD